MSVNFNNLDGVDGANAGTAPGSGAAVQLAGSSTTVSATYDELARGEGRSAVAIGAVPQAGTRFLFMPLPAGESGQGSFVYEALIMLPQLPGGTAALQVHGLNTSGTPVARIDVFPDGSVQLFTSGSANVGNKYTATKLVAGRFYRMGVAVKTGVAGSSLISGYVAEAYTSTPFFTSSDTTRDTSTRTITGAASGVTVSQGAAPGGVVVDAMRFETGSTTFVHAGLAARPVSDTVDKGLERLRLEVVRSNQRRDARVAAAQAKADGAIPKPAAPASQQPVVENPDGTFTTVPWPTSAPAAGDGSTVSGLTTTDLDNAMGA